MRVYHKNAEFDTNQAFFSLIRVGVVDIDALTEYVEQLSPIAVTGPKRRITFNN